MSTKPKKKASSKKAIELKAAAKPKASKTGASKTGADRKVDALRLKKAEAHLGPPPPDRDRSVEESRAKLAKAAKGPYGRYVKLLLDLRDRILDDIEFHASDNLKRSQKDASSDLSAYSFHMADAGTDNFDREFALSMVSNEQEALYEINEALKRLENGTYGVCEMSGKPIPKARLDAIPWARYTVECQAEIEKTQQKRTPQTFQLSDFGNSEEETIDKDEED